MPRYFFRCPEQQGANLKGIATANDEAELSRQLRALGLTSFELEPAGVWHLLQAPPPPGQQESANLFRFMALAFSNGISLVKILEGVQVGNYSRSLTGFTRILTASLEAGHMPSVVIRRIPNWLPQAVGGMLNSGEVSGMMAAALTRIADLLEEQARMARKLRSALVYPAIILVVFLILMSFFTLHLIPLFAAVFLSFEVEPPLVLKAALWMRSVVEHPVALFLCLQGALALVVWTRSQFVHGNLKARVLDKALDLPVLGPLYERYLLAQFFALQTELLMVGVDLLTSLRTAAASFPEGRFRRAVMLVIEEVMQGDTLAGALNSSGAFPALAIQFVAAGEESGRIVQLMDKLSKVLRASFEETIEATLALIEPLLIGLMGLIVAVFVVSLIGPMFTLFREVGV